MRTQTRATRSALPHFEPSDVRLEGPFVESDVPREVAALRREPGWKTDGHAGRTLAKYPDLRVVLEAMRRGQHLPIHETAERMTLQLIDGRIRIRLHGGETKELRAGSFVAIDPSRVHEIESLEECAFLLTLAWPPAPTRVVSD